MQIRSINKFLKCFLASAFLMGSTANLMGQWSQAGNTIVGTDSDFGFDVELSGDGQCMIVGSPFSLSAGTAAVYERSDANEWELVGDLIQGDTSSDRLGYSVAINQDGSVVAVSLPGLDNPTIELGKVRVFTLENGQWIQRGEDINTSGGFEFGWEIDLDNEGNSIAITSIGASGGDVVYGWNGSDWVQRGQLFVEEGDFSPFSTSLSGDGMHIAFGSPNMFGLVDEPGSVYVYTWNGSNWEQKGNSIAAELTYNDFGNSVSIDDAGTRVAIGIPDYRDENNDARGAVKIFSYDNGVWLQLGSDLLGEGENDEFGANVKLSTDGNIVVSSALKNDNDGGSNAGHVKAYMWNGSSWEQRGNPIIGSDFNDEFGYSIGLSANGNTILSTSKGAKEVKCFEWNQSTFAHDLKRNKIRFGPNPSHDLVQFGIQDQSIIQSFSLSDSEGKKYLMNKKVEDTYFQVELPENSGIYFVEIVFDDRKTATIPIMKY